MEKIQFDRVHLLVVEDNLFMRNLYSAILRAMDFEQIRMASDGSEAFELMRDFPPDIIITDAAMQPLDGYDFARLVRTARDSPDPFVPIIMVTGYHNRASVERARDVGINEYLAKPVTPAGLYARITQVILRPRPFVRTSTFFGPDRRRRSPGNYRGPFRRASDREARMTEIQDVNPAAEDMGSLPSPAAPLAAAPLADAVEKDFPQ